ncbi:undecaprenyldiphospho-muramoylpentapeptide beta-N-acetylglucosaminyltransferase [Paracidovorax citrulli]|uniref:UDP-N-acetylglucosamine--N-acetylmuramyl-(pentapeptide) pyrophosphoryl-undecaprenol N-acetylglucosamine transferase n=2 Tax=Paracidovorax citrulli TaxID=80869 RepID=MURG_PARC0|nr:undecaprenyldiphospho-muramoylpentapeptide beta-N-acetylglucosaminyltransferase [Paracidovorax citrulli]A1TKD1.1 RecName: Full=UDP-N-acetylglucosamine--N-acetylmuramyl-(pentapeptide) pyrophosphoryl-undecaprenol N-acetylglucosamine transferase; AltName: Full=Undecaprenyl-PP-MurNAc-pentapeptide-UDPGlcNAc GlcNAc transferase [Paracidovorax citrulli AAC00-1]ABM31419.1 UDP-N-acetylglucosamine--N-acetylmuramyl-(pentapeptide) pyrophosphoryl-undecaprenol N-acetylglucosamine transferase [Paracidovorax c
MTHPRTALVMAGGTGGHIFPGLAVAEELRARGWKVHWLGTPGSMESRIVPPQGFAFEPIDFSGVRGKGLATLALLPLRLLRAFWQALAVVRRVQPDVVVGLGGYVTFPGGMMAVLCGKPLVVHEQNSVAGLVNKVLAGVADRVFTAFPGALRKGAWVGNPLRTAFTRQADPQARFAGRGGPLRLLVVGGSLGAKALNDIVPQALALIPAERRPVVTHQSGTAQIDALRANYAAAGVEATLTPFIDDTATAFAEADLIVCRAGASTVTEIAAVGAAAVFVPFPHAVDDHQTANARFLADAGGGWLVQQRDLSAEALAQLLQNTEREALLERALKAKTMQKIHATREVANACEELTA